jgi:Nucleoside transporter
MSTSVNFYVVFALLVIFGAFSGTAQGSVFSMAAGLPFKYMGAVMFGSGICGVSTNALRAVTLIAFPIVEGAPD